MTAAVTVDPTADTSVEPDETVALTLAAGTGYTIGTAGAVVETITNDDVPLPAITLAVSPAAVTEDGTTNLIYTFSRSRGCGTKNLVSEAAMAAPLTITEFDTYDLRFPTSRHLRGTTTTATPAAVARTIQVSRA